MTSSLIRCVEKPLDNCTYTNKKIRYFSNVFFIEQTCGVFVSDLQRICVYVYVAHKFHIKRWSATSADISLYYICEWYAQTKGMWYELKMSKEICP